MQRVGYHRLAAAELTESAQFYDERQARLGDEFLTAVDAVLVVIRAQPERGRREIHGTFSFRTERFPFRIVYEVQRDRIWVVAVAHLSGQGRKYGDVCGEEFSAQARRKRRAYPAPDLSG